MYDGPKIIAGLVIFAVLMTFPIWYNVASGKASYTPELEKVQGQKNCVEDLEYMRAWHMDLLVTWRDDVVRDGNRVHKAPDGKEYDKSLTKTCLDCHKDKSKFCDKCHEFAGVKNAIDCWNCHINPEGTK